MLKAKTIAELTEESKKITEEIKQKINCEKLECDGYHKEIEDECNENNQLESGINLIEKNGYWIVRYFYYYTADSDFTNYYYFKKKPNKKEIDYAHCLADIHTGTWGAKIWGAADVEMSTLRSLKRLKNLLFNEAPKEIKVEVGEMTEKMKKVFEAKKRLVEKGKSVVFNEFNSEVNVSKEDFIKALEWLEADPMIKVNDEERISREVGFDIDGKVIYGERYYNDKGDYVVTYPVDLKLGALDFPRRRLTKKDIL